MPPKKDELCDDCGVPLVVRADDTPAAILKRLENYKTATEPMIAYLKEKKRVIVINGEPPVEEVFRQIIKKIS
jgi:adenylate kinase